MINPRPWFGNRLDWQRQPDGSRAAWHGGRAHTIVKVTGHWARSERTTPGTWHLWDDNAEGDPTRWNGLGPGVGTNLATAKEIAEAWIICGRNQMMDYPPLNSAISNAGLLYEGLVVWLDEPGRFSVFRDRPGQPASNRGELVGEVVPRFNGAPGVMTVRWKVERAGFAGWDYSTWGEALAHLREKATRG